MHYVQAVVAQSVERRLGKAEVGGSNPLGSSMKTLEFSRVFFYLISSFIICRMASKSFASSIRYLLNSFLFPEHNMTKT